MEETISLKELFQVLKKRLGLIVIITLIATMTSGIISYFFLTPIYSASTQLLVNQKKSDEQAYNVGEVQTNLQLINTYSVIIKSPAILEKVKDELNIEHIGELSVTSENNSQVVSILIEDPNPVMAADIVNTVANVFQKEIATIMNVDNVSILSKAEVPDDPNPVKPNPTLNMAIAFVVGAMIGIGLAFLLEYLDNTIRTEQDIEKLLQLPVLGAITVITEEAELQGLTKNQPTRRVRGESVGS
ncbi:YveK family protein [Bacillus suaedaesalsae]|uniref:Capsular biosynthesis protein n=1 Tax=Bacillus suaedaesalsae TaxID=2810349 RepID=A0ABS2DNJ5_9BACI|nr:Wzz/FepE/Etk N-terminal domain-containing protein [Bacillus suaedaesalsae]MBM6619106.1 capsular biosynthesis protein [Bacillus suaedaesalsae]